MMIFLCNDLIVQESLDYLQFKNVLLLFNNLCMEHVLILWTNIANSVKVQQVNALNDLCTPLLHFFSQCI
jgi:hypothetical protein